MLMKALRLCLQRTHLYWQGLRRLDSKAC